jgi:hypothetical protein
MSLKLSASALETVALCQRKAYLAHVLERTALDEIPAFVVGSVVHEVLALHFQNKPAPLGALDTRGYREWSDNVLPELDLDDRTKQAYSFDNIFAVLDQYIFTHPLDSFPFEIVSVERRFDLRLDGFPFVGRFDLVVRSQEGIYVIDHKTTKSLSAWTTKRLEPSAQLTAYLWAAAKLYPSERIAGAFGNFIEVAALPSSTRRCREHGVPFAECGVLHARSELYGPITRDPFEISSWVRTASRLGAALHELNELRHLGDGLKDLDRVTAEGPFTGACVGCEFQDFCRLGARPEHAATMLKPRYKD